MAHTELATAPGHPFYDRLSAVLDAEGFDRFVESLCARFHAPQFGRPSLTPGIYFRSLSIGYFEGLGAEFRIASERDTMPQPKRAIELRYGLALDPHPSRNTRRKFQSFERSMRELESAIGDHLTMVKLRAILPSWVSPSRLDDHQVIHHVATMVAQGWATLVHGTAHAEGISPEEGRRIIETAKLYLGVDYSQDVSAATTDNKKGTTTGIDCSHLVCFAAGLGYLRAEDIVNSPKLLKLRDAESRQDGDVVVFTGGEHVVLWDASPPTSGSNLLGATVHKGVTWLAMNYKDGRPTFRGTPVFFRKKR